MPISWMSRQPRTRPLIGRSSPPLARRHASDMTKAVEGRWGSREAEILTVEFVRTTASWPTS